MSKTIKALLIILGYMGVRALIYACIPAQSYELWFFRDMVMTLPRTAGFLLSLWVLHGVPGTFWLKIKDRSGAGILAGILVGQTCAIASFPWVLPFSALMAKIGWGTTLAVAFFEETCFRGVLFQDLKERLNPLKAAVVSTLIFACFHIQAQPITNWPAIFLVGFSLCGAYYRGAGLIWLILVHELTDGFYLHVNTGDMQRVYMLVLAYVVLALTSIWSVRVLREPSPTPGTTAQPAMPY